MDSILFNQIQARIEDKITTAEQKEKFNKIIEQLTPYSLSNDKVANLLIQFEKTL